MANSWFRLYAEVINDTKLLAVTEALRWRYVALLCMQCNGEYANTPDDEIAIALRISEQEWIETRDVFIKRKLLNADGSMRKWDERQYISDLKDPTAAERQKRYRDNKRNGTVTSRLPESDTDTESDNKKPKTIVRTSSTRFSDFWSAWPKSPRKVDKAKCEKKWAILKLDAIADQIIQHVVAISKTKQWIEGFEPAPMTYLNGGRWADEIFTGEGTTQSNTKPWYISNTGIEAKASELGIVQGKDEMFPYFKVRVYKAAGITQDMVSTANEDFSQRKAA